MPLKNIKHNTCNIEGTVIHLAVEGIYAGYMIIANELKKDVVQAIKSLKELGFEKRYISGRIFSPKHATRDYLHFHEYPTK